MDHLTLEVPAGEICVLVGPSGCGKTTAMRMVNRTVEMTAGDILVGGESVRDRDPARLRREIGYVIQQIGLFPHRTIAENIGAVPQLLGWKKERTRARTDELLQLIGLDPELGDRYPVQLSGGQQQRVGVARALAADPLVMLMDEPFGAIDPINRERLQNEFLRLQAQVRKTVLFVTHDIDEAIKMGDRIAILREGGRVAQYATPAEVLMAPADEFVEDFVGADRALKRLALMRVSDIDLWEAPLAYVGQPTAEVRAKLAAARRRSPLPAAGRQRAPPARLALRARPPRPASCRPRPDSPLGPLLERDDVMRDALADLLQGEAQYAAVADARRPDRRRALGRDHLRVPQIAARRRRRSTAPWSAPMTSPGGPGDGRRSRQGLHPGTQLRHAALPGGQRQALLLRLGAGKHRPLRDADRRSTSNWSSISVALGFAAPFALALLAHRRRWLQPPLLAATGVLFTIPSIAFFFLLLPITGRGRDTAIIALAVYTLQIIYRNTMAGLANVPTAIKEAARGMGMTDRQILWRVELRLATPEIVAGLQIATVSTVAIATLAVFAGGGGLGQPLYASIDFATNIIIAGGIAFLMAIAFGVALLGVQRLLTPWRRAGVIGAAPPPPGARLDRGGDRIHLLAPELERDRRQEGRRLRPGGRTHASISSN